MLLVRVLVRVLNAGYTAAVAAYVFAHVEFAERDAVESALSEVLRGLGVPCEVAQVGAFRKGLLHPLGSSEPPSYMGLAADSSGWTRIAWCSFHTLPDVFTALSRHLAKSKIVVAVAESVSSSYYLAVYEGGELLLRLDNLGDDTSEPIITERFADFPIDEDGGFDFDDMAGSVASLGLSLEFDVDAVEWRTLKTDWPKPSRAVKEKKRKRFWLF